ncbi:MAG: glycosyltransferase family 9 protein [Planctomycetes bacterium]|nr:glycosyltransferase family 9 protein [Planctomycetota bacterium]
MRPENPSPGLVVVKPGALGDTLLLAPALRAVRNARPGMDITVVGTMPYVRLLEFLGVASSAVSFDTHGIPGGNRPEGAVTDDPVLAFLGAPPDRCGARAAPAPVYRPPVPPDSSTHVAVWLYRCLREVVPDAAPLSDDPFPLPSGGNVLIEPPYAVIAPGAGGRRKRAPLPLFIQAAERLAAAGVSPLWLAGEVEVAHGLVDSYPPRYPRLVEPDILSLPAVLANACEVYANDSGVAHLAALVGAPVTVFFGETDPGTWRPWGTNVRIERFPLNT